MYVRWKTRKFRYKPAARAEGAECALYAVLVESRRVDGKPRQRVVRQLGRIWDGPYLEAPHHTRRFWTEVDEALDKVGLHGEVRGRIEASLLRVVARPTEAEARELRREDNLRKQIVHLQEELKRMVWRDPVERRRMRRDIAQMKEKLRLLV